MRTDSYVYYKQELIDSSQVINYPNSLENKSAFVQNVFAKIYDLNGAPKGYVSFTNNTTEIKTPNNIQFTTSIGTIKTPLP